MTIDRLDELIDAATDPERLEILALAKTALLAQNARQAAEEWAREDASESSRRAIADACGTAEVGIQRAQESWGRSVFRIGTRDTIAAMKDSLRVAVADTPFYRGYRGELARLIESWKDRADRPGLGAQGGG